MHIRTHILIVKKIARVFVERGVKSRIRFCAGSNRRHHRPFRLKALRFMAYRPPIKWYRDGKGGGVVPNFRPLIQAYEGMEGGGGGGRRGLEGVAIKVARNNVYSVPVGIGRRCETPNPPFDHMKILARPGNIYGDLLRTLTHSWWTCFCVWACMGCTLLPFESCIRVRMATSKYLVFVRVCDL